jgi:hypothetical protein
MSKSWPEMRDAAYATGIGDGWDGAVAGYYGGPLAYHVWLAQDWRLFPTQRKLPIWVAGFNGAEEGVTAVGALRELGVPAGVWTAVDMEIRVDKTYLEHFGAVMAASGYKVWVYGSADTVFMNPPLSGYWVADYAGIGPFMYERAGAEVRATQYASGPEYDSSTVKAWTYWFGRWWR